MQDNEWMYCLLDSDGRSYYIENGILNVSASPKRLRYGPDGWKDISLGWERSFEDWGNVVNYSLPNTFVLDGADILRTLLDMYNIEKVVNLLIKRQALFINATNYYFYYKFFYRGEIDLSTYKDNETGFTVSITQGAVSKSIKAFKNTAFPVDPDDALVYMDGATMVGVKKFIVLPVSYNHAVSGAFDVKEMIPLQEATTEGNFFNIYFAPSVASPVDANESFIQGEDLTVSTKYNGMAREQIILKSINITGSIGPVEGQTHPARYGLDFILETNTGRVIFLFTLNAPPTIQPDNPFNITSPQITLFKDETFFIYHRPNVTQFGNRWQFTENTLLTYTTYDKVPPSFVKAKLCFNLFTELVNKTTGTTEKGISTLLQSKNNLAVTCGDALRGLEGAKIKTSLATFNKAFNVMLNTGSGIIKEKYYLEKKEFFLQDDNVIPLGQVKNFERFAPVDIMGNVVKIGYQPKDSDSVNGKSSFNNTNIYTSPVQKIVKDISLISDYITDPFVIELYRANLEGKKTTDDSKDDTVFVLNIDFNNPQTLTEDTAGYPAGTVYYKLKRVVYDEMTGVENGDTLYNIEELTPARLLETHSNYLNALFYQFAGQKLIFQTASKNANLYTRLGSVIYKENADFTIRNSPRLFKPMLFEFIPPPKSELAEILDENPNRCFSFIHPNGNTYRGFNIKLGLAPNTEEEQVFQLLAVDNQDLSTLKTY